MLSHWTGMLSWVIEHSYSCSWIVIPNYWNILRHINTLDSCLRNHTCWIARLNKNIGILTSQPESSAVTVWKEDPTDRDSRQGWGWHFSMQNLGSSLAKRFWDSLARRDLGKTHGTPAGFSMIFWGICAFHCPLSGAPHQVCQWVWTVPALPRTAGKQSKTSAKDQVGRLVSRIVLDCQHVSYLNSFLNMSLYPYCSNMI